MSSSSPLTTTASGTISATDLALLHVTDDPDEAVEFIHSFTDKNPPADLETELR